MAEPEKQFEYGLTKEETAPGILGFFNLMSGPLVDMVTPSRREVISPKKVDYELIPDQAQERYKRVVTPAVYGPEERGLEYMPVVQGAKAGVDLAKKVDQFLVDPAFRSEVMGKVGKGIGSLPGIISQVFDDYYRSAVNLAQTGETRSFDPKRKKEIPISPLLPLELGLGAGLTFPVKGSGTVVGMFAGRKSATANKDKLKMAEEMAQQGVDRTTIWQKTGYFRYQDKEGKPISDWRYEISDQEARAIQRPDLITPTGRLRIVGGEEVKPRVSDLFEDRAVFEAYPGLKDVPNAEVSIGDIFDRREAVQKKLLELKKKNLTPEEFEIEYKKLQDEDAEILRELVQGKPSTATSDEKVASKDLETGQPIIKRALADIPMGKERGDASGTFSPQKDKITAKNMPGKIAQDAWLYSKTIREEIGNRLEKIKSELRKEGFEVHGPSNRKSGRFRLSADGEYRGFIGPESRGHYLSSKDFEQIALRNDQGDALKDPQQLKNDLLEKHVPSLARPEDKRPGLYDPEDLAKIRAERDAGGTGDASILFKDNPIAAKLFREYEDTWEAAKRLNTEDIENMDEFFRSTQLHEIQHAIQARERGQEFRVSVDSDNPGWEGGSNPREFESKYFDKVIKDPDTGEKLRPIQIYRRTLGEAEARLTQTRRNYSQELRDRIPPWEDLDVPEYKLLRRGVDF